MLKNWKHKKMYWVLRELHARFFISISKIKNSFKHTKKTKPRILFFHMTGLGYGGTESFLQFFAKYLDKKKWDVYYMYSDKTAQGSGIEDLTSRLNVLLEGQVFPVRFDYTDYDHKAPYCINGMNPDFFSVLKTLDIDLLVVAGSGHANFPFSKVLNIPIIFINVFGEINLQTNIKYHFCISQEVANKLYKFIPKEKVLVTYVPTEGPNSESLELGLKLRKSLGIAKEDFVFGRIGRNENDIFDSIGILAFEKLVKIYSKAHYLIVSPAEQLVSMVKQRNIPNVHFVPGSGRLVDLWSFYFAMDVLAHFRKDGESFGLNIAQAMLCGRPVISHKSKQWNAHLEYLEPNFSRVAEVDNVEQYFEFMKYFFELLKSEFLKMGQEAKIKAEKICLIQNNIQNYEQIIHKILK